MKTSIRILGIAFSMILLLSFSSNDRNQPDPCECVVYDGAIDPYDNFFSDCRYMTHVFFNNCTKNVKIYIKGISTKKSSFGEKENCSFNIEAGTKKTYGGCFTVESWTYEVVDY